MTLSIRLPAWPHLELAVVEYIGWYNGAHLHESLDHTPPLEYEQQHALQDATTLTAATV